MSRPLDIAVIGAGNRGFHTFAECIRRHPDTMRLVAVAEPDRERRERFCRRFSVPPENSFAGWEEFVQRPQICPAVINATQDRQHTSSTRTLLQAGYHVLLEKPMAVSASDCVNLVAAARETGRILQICHVLRYSRMFTRIKTLLDQGAIGAIQSILLAENIGFWHMAHSYVRGNWRDSNTASPILLAKSCHDLDLLIWMTGKRPRAVAAFGELSHFTPEQAPPGSPERCTDGCPAAAECPYEAVRFYTRGRPRLPVSFLTGITLKSVLAGLRRNRFTFTQALTTDLSPGAIRKALETGPYGRCVYRCDNNVPDHQVVNVEFEGGVTALFSLSAFTPVWERTLKIMGTRGEIRAADFKGRLEIRTFHPLKSRSENIRFSVYDHGGGDDRLLQDFVRNVRRGRAGEALTSAAASLDSHLLCFAGEQARRSRMVIDFGDFRRQIP